MALPRLIITSGIPVVFFYISSHNFEQNVDIRYRKLQYARELAEKLGSRTLKASHNDSSFARGYYAGGAWIRNINIDSTGIAPAAYSGEEYITTQILSLFHVYLTDQSIIEDKISAPAAGDSSFL